MKHKIIKWLLRGQDKDSNLVSHAERELRMAGLFDEDSDYGGMLGDAVMDMVRLFSMEGHSGASAGRSMQLFKIVGSFGNLMPITSDPDEWMEVGSGDYQNRRNPSLFSKDGGKNYYSVDDKERITKPSASPVPKK